MYANELLVINQWEDVDLDCKDDLSEGIITADCKFPDGDTIINFYGFKKVIICM